MSAPSPIPSTRAVVCPICTRYIGGTSLDAGTVTLYCRGCRRYQTVDLALPMARRRDAGKPVELLDPEE